MRNSNAPSGEITDKTEPVTCKLTTPRFRERKATVLERLRSQILEKKELENGFEFRFSGTDSMLDELTEFIKTERTCCTFFTFGLTIGAEENDIRLRLTGPVGSKEFIESELEL